ncbi:hypothetical protein F5146DRAFT_167464 [Armillaria mellea]|nr:hypothetical protein F5146DRAFT_167464 [Armillaria mellea]
MYLTTLVSEVPYPEPSAFDHSSTQSDTPSPAAIRRPTPKHVPRPPNAFILFRSDYWRENKDIIREGEISRVCGELWRALRPAEKQVHSAKVIGTKEDHLAEIP